MATSRFQNLDPDKQEQILEAAVEEFAEKGFEGASINRIIELAGISKGSMYYYFEDKADLYDTALRDATERLLAMAGGFDIDQIQSDTFWEYLKGYTERSVVELKRNQKYIQLARGFYSTLRPDDPDSPGGEMMDWARQVTEQLIARGQEVGVVRTDLPRLFLVQISMAMGTVIDQWTLEHFDDFDEDQFAELMDKEIDLLRRLWSPADKLHIEEEGQ